MEKLQSFTSCVFSVHKNSFNIQTTREISQNLLSVKFPSVKIFAYESPKIAMFWAENFNVTLCDQRRV